MVEPVMSQFPVGADKCPCCGSTETDESAAVEVQIARGKLPPNAVPNYSSEVALMANPQLAGLSLPGSTIPSLIKKVGTCHKCGVKYRVKADIKDQKVGANDHVTVDTRL